MRRLTCCLWGATKCWKTTFALGWPGPIEFFDFNHGLEGVIEDIHRDDIAFHAYRKPLFGGHDERKALLDRFRNDYAKAMNAALKRPAAEQGTFVIDTATELDDLAKSVTLEEIRVHKYNAKKEPEDFQAQARDYGPRNEFMETVIMAPLGAPGLNAVFIHQDADIWEGMENTGRIRLAGWKRTPKQTQITIEAFRPSPKENPQGRLYNCRLGKGLNKLAEGLVLAELSYEFLSGILEEE